MTLGLAGLALIAYAIVRAGSGPHVENLVAPEDAFADSRSSITADQPAGVSVSATDSTGALKNLPGPAPLADVGEAPPPLAKVEADFKTALACFNSEQPCVGYLTTSYHEYQVDVLTHMQAIVENEYLAVVRDPSIKTPEHEDFGRDLVSNQQPELQLIGIKMLELFDPSQPNLDAISNCLAHTLSEGLFEQGMLVLNEKYAGNAAYASEIRDTLEHQIQYGIDETTSHRAAQELYHYLDANSFKHFQLLEQKLNQTSKERYTALDSVLREYAAAHR